MLTQKLEHMREVCDDCGKEVKATQTELGCSVRESWIQ